MTLLSDLRIRTKILCLTIPSCFIGIASSAYIAFNYKIASDTYSTFIEKNNIATVEVVRASAIITNSSYTAYQLLAYAASGKPHSALSETFTANTKLLQSRFETARRLMPDAKDQIDGFAERYSEIVAVSERALKLADAGEFEEAGRFLASIDGDISALIRDMKTWNDSATRSIVEQSEMLSSAANFTIITSGLALITVFGLAIILSLLVASKGITGPISKLRERMLALAENDVASPIFGVGRKDELGQMASAVLVFQQNAIDRQALEEDSQNSRVQAERDRGEREAQKAREADEVDFAIRSLASALEDLANGNLANRLETPFAARLDPLRLNFNDSVSKLRHALGNVGANAKVIEAGASEIQAGADDLSKRTEQQAASIEETAAALEQITTAVKDSTNRAEEAGVLIAGAKRNAEHSGEVVRQAIDAMEKIERSSGEIGNIIGVIDEIAFQTNLLALNAGVEAARAGEAGKGFAVVAQEVRELAQRSAQAAKEIKVLIDASGQQVKTGVKLVGDTGEALHSIVAEVQAINRHVAAIIEAAREQSTGLQEINIAVNSMDQGTQQNAAMVEQSTAASHTLAREVEGLNRLLAQFRLQADGIRLADPAIHASASSPANELRRRIMTVHGGMLATADQPNWQEF